MYMYIHVYTSTCIYIYKNLLNKQTEIFSTCRHRNKFLIKKINMPRWRTAMRSPDYFYPMYIHVHVYTYTYIHDEKFVLKLLSQKTSELPNGNRTHVSWLPVWLFCHHTIRPQTASMMLETWFETLICLFRTWYIYICIYTHTHRYIYMSLKNNININVTFYEPQIRIDLIARPLTKTETSGASFTTPRHHILFVFLLTVIWINNMITIFFINMLFFLISHINYI